MSMPPGLPTALVVTAIIIAVMAPVIIGSHNRLEKAIPAWRATGEHCAIKHSFLECEKYCEKQARDYETIHVCIEGAMGP